MENKKSRIAQFFTTITEEAKQKVSKMRTGNAMLGAYRKEMLGLTADLSDAKQELDAYLGAVFSGDRAFSTADRMGRAFAVKNAEEAIALLKEACLEDLNKELKDPEQDGDFED